MCCYSLWTFIVHLPLWAWLQTLSLAFYSFIYFFMWTWSYNKLKPLTGCDSLRLVKTHHRGVTFFPFLICKCFQDLDSFVVSLRCLFYSVILGYTLISHNINTTWGFYCCIGQGSAWVVWSVAIQPLYAASCRSRIHFSHVDLCTPQHQSHQVD